MFTKQIKPTISKCSFYRKLWNKKSAQKY